MHEHAQEGTLTRGADGALYLLRPGTCVRVQDAQGDLPDTRLPENEEAAVSRDARTSEGLSTLDDHASARITIDADDHRSARITIDAGDHRSARITIDAGDELSSRITIEPHDHGSSRITVDPGEGLVN